MAYHRYHGVDAKIVRIFNTYGPRMRLRDGRAVPNFIGQALTGEDVTVYGDGAQTRSLCYVSDLVDGVIRLMLSNANDPINIGNPQELTIEQIARTIIRLTGSSSRIVYRACRSTIRRCASPTSRERPRSWTGARRWASTKGSAGRSSISEGNWRLVERAAHVHGVVEPREQRDRQAHPYHDVHHDRRLLQEVEQQHDGDGDDVERRGDFPVD